jgi:hypothetical protein
VNYIEAGVILETIGFFLCFSILAIIGFGPAIWFVTTESKRLYYALALAPALGYALLGFVSLPLVRYVAPVKEWAWPVTLGMFVISIGLSFFELRRTDITYRSNIRLTTTALALGFFLICAGILVVPLLYKGIQYAAFRSNPSDAFNYISLAETLRVASWKTLLDGAVLTRDNLDSLRALANISPTALFAARFIDFPFSVSKMVMLAWAAQISGVPVHRFYYAQHLLAFALSLPLVMIIGDLLQLRKWLTFGLAGAVAVGFWALFILDTDAGYEISTLPMTLMVVIAWILLERESSLRVVSRNRLLLALSVAVIFGFYPSIELILIVAFVWFYGLGLLQKTLPIKQILYQGLTILLACGLLFLTGQFDFILRSVVYRLSTVDVQQTFYPTVFNFVRTGGSAAFWGMPDALWSPLPSGLEGLTKQFAAGIGIFLSASVVVMIGLSGRKMARLADRIIVSMVVAGLALSLWYLLHGNYRVAGKVFTYVYPFTMCCALLLSNYLDLFFQPLGRKLALIVYAAWLTTQVVAGVYLPTTEVMSVIVPGVGKNGNFDLSPITRYLDSHSPKLLLVMIPREDTYVVTSEEAWPFAYYAMFEFSKYPVYFQSGLIIDNALSTANRWFASLSTTPDYAVILKRVDYIGPENLGTKVAETQDLLLYRITVGSRTAFDYHEHLFIQDESRKSPLPP